MKKKKILITGANGTIGRCLTEGLRSREQYEVLATDVREDRGLDISKLDVTDAGQVREAARGVDTILHFGWAKDEEDFLGKVLPVNVAAAYHIYEAARENKVGRVIFASSNHATGYYKVGEEVSPDEPYRPDSFYGLSKCYIELLGRLYADKHRISSINIRIGNFPKDDRPHSERAAHIWISCRDMVQLAVCCIDADLSTNFLCLYGTSANTDNYYDIGYLEELIGYKPKDNAAKLLEEAKKQHRPIKDDETSLQGGGYANKDPAH